MFVHDAFDDHDVGAHDVGAHDVGAHDPGIADPSATTTTRAWSRARSSCWTPPTPAPRRPRVRQTRTDRPPSWCSAAPTGHRSTWARREVSSTGEGGPMDTVTAVSDDGSSVGVYTDTDGDGTVDQIIDVHRGRLVHPLPAGRRRSLVGRPDRPYRRRRRGRQRSPASTRPPPARSRPPSVTEDSDDEGPDDESADGPQITVPGADGTGFSGAATYDATGDGTNDTVVVQAEDGSVTTATDYDGDGVADQITVVRPDGTVTVAAADQDGRWATVASGHITEDGGVVFDGPVGGDEPPAGRRRRAGRRTGRERTPFQGSPPDTSPSATAGTGSTPGAPGTTWTVTAPPKPPSIDAGGKVVQVSDTDGDGRADQMLQIQPDRTATILIDSGDGWQVEAHGVLSADGDFVPDGTAPAAGDDDRAGEPPHRWRRHRAHRRGRDRPSSRRAGPGPRRRRRARIGRRQDCRRPPADRQRHRRGRGRRPADRGRRAVRRGDLGAPGRRRILGGGAVRPSRRRRQSGGGRRRRPGRCRELPVRPVRPRAIGCPSRWTAGRSTPVRPPSTPTATASPDTVMVDGPQGSTLYYQDTDGDGVADRAWTSDASGAVVAEYTLDSHSGTWTSTGS